MLIEGLSGPNWPEEGGRSLCARGIEGGLPVPSMDIEPLFGTEPNAGADGATGGGDTSRDGGADSAGFGVRASGLTRR